MVFIPGTYINIAIQIADNDAIMRIWHNALMAEGVIAMASAAISFTATESWRVGMVIAHDIQKWLDKRRQKQLEAATAKARAEGEAKANKACRSGTPAVSMPNPVTNPSLNRPPTAKSTNRQLSRHLPLGGLPSPQPSPRMGEGGREGMDSRLRGNDGGGGGNDGGGGGNEEEGWGNDG